MTKYIN